ncbi:MAG: MIP/aquaporin family protein [Crocinitomicaceae bacterium]|nr:aquaporin family protein [Crocinitomicaceae bacterium]
MRSFFGELIGTFILVLFGCGVVGWSLFIQPLDLIQISIVWGLTVILAIFCSAPYSRAHLNPAVSIAFLIDKAIPKKELLPHLFGQFVGGLMAAYVLYLLFKEYLDLDSVNSAMMFGEYFPNPGNKSLTVLGHLNAFGAEFTGTFLLMFGILLIIKYKGVGAKLLNPILIGVLLTLLIYFFAPYTQAGFNPFRDFAPRLLSYLMGWDKAFSYNGWGWLTVYMIAPILGAISAALLDKILFKNNK